MPVLDTTLYKTWKRPHMLESADAIEAELSKMSEDLAEHIIWANKQRVPSKDMRTALHALDRAIDVLSEWKQVP